MSKARVPSQRQQGRQSLLALSMMLFPVTIYYFSPALILMAAAEGVVNASFLVFGLLFLSALVVGRLWCGWLCPAGGLQELGAARVNNKRVSPRLRWVKWGIWLPWVALIAVLAVRAGGYRQVNVLYQLEGGNSVNAEGWAFIFPLILVLMMAPAALLGRRASCHWLCWMAPFLILGQKLGNAVRLPRLGLVTQPEACIECGRCTRDCPMSLDVQAKIASGRVADDECILCGTCADNCPEQVIHYGVRMGR